MADDARVAQLDEELAKLGLDHAGQIEEVRAALAESQARIRELEHDLAALAQLLGGILGEPFRSHANAIVSKRQTGEGR